VAAVVGEAPAVQVPEREQAEAASVPVVAAVGLAVAAKNRDAPELWGRPNQILEFVRVPRKSRAPDAEKIPPGAA